MKRQLFKLLIGLVWVTIAFQTGTIAQETPPTEKHTYPEDFVTDYLAECRKLAIAEDLTPEEADTLCDCTIKRFQEQYSFEDYQKLDQETKEDIGYACFDEILYED